MTDDAKPVTLETVDAVAVITIDRPPVNALDSVAFTALGDAAAEIAEREDIRVGVLTGAGSTFCAGADVGELEGQSPEARKAFFAVSSRTRRNFLTMPIPIIAAINGPAAGAGVAYATFCDYRVASRDAFFTMPEIGLASVAAGGVPLAAIGVPSGMLRMMLFSARRIPATEALGIHLVDEVAEPDRVMAVALEHAAVIAEHPRRHLVAMKQAINLTRDALYGEDYRMAQTQQLTLDLLGEARDD